jgi:cathepsin B
MKAIVILGLLSIACGGFINSNLHLYLQKNAPYRVYTPEENPFRDWTREEIKSLFVQNEDLPPIAPTIEDPVPNDLPTSFDARAEWSNCVQPIRNQESCGSCWAFAGSSSLAWKFCIATSGSTNVVLSPQDSVACDTSNSGCNGGNRLLTWQYYQKSGIVSDSCYPYTAGKGNVEACRSACVSGEAWKKYKATNVKTLSNPTQIKNALMEGGPIHTGFTVYDDFMEYSGGIYEYVSGSSLGGHAVVIVGWGVEAGTSYWIVQNSWGPEWGENGYFRIKEGECSFDTYAVTGNPVV